MTVKTKVELDADFADGQSRTITATKIRDFIDSIGVGGLMSCSAESVAVTTNWAAFSGFTDSIDTKGVTETLATGLFTLGAGADGIYTATASMGMTLAAGSGDVTIGISKNGAAPTYTKTVTMNTGEYVDVTVIGGGSFVEGDTIGLGWKATANTNLTVTGQFRIKR